MPIVESKFDIPIPLSQSIIDTVKQQYNNGNTSIKVETLGTADSNREHLLQRFTGFDTLLIMDEKQRVLDGDLSFPPEVETLFIVGKAEVGLFLLAVLFDIS